MNITVIGPHSPQQVLDAVAFMLKDVPNGVLRLRIKGDFKLNKKPHYHEAGWDVFHLNAEKIDWADSCNAARDQLFPGKALPAVDRVWEGCMQRLAEARKAA